MKLSLAQCSCKGRKREGRKWSVKDGEAGLESVLRDLNAMPKLY